MSSTRLNSPAPSNGSTFRTGKVLDPRSGRVTTVAGTGAMGSADGPLKSATFHEPGGIAAAADKLYVADTNNHVIRRIDLEVGQVGTVVL